MTIRIYIFLELMLRLELLGISSSLLDEAQVDGHFANLLLKIAQHIALISAFGAILGHRWCIFRL